MPELTSQDRESYVKLCDAAKALLDEIDNQEGIKIHDSFTLKELTKAFASNLLTVDLLKPKNLPSFEELQSRVELTGGYLTMYQLFTQEIEGITVDATKTAINKASQKLSIQYNQLKVSLSAVDDDFLENVTIPSSDPLFLKLLTDREVKSWTQQILSDRPPALTDDQVQQLINAWGTAVTGFVEDARKDANDSDPVKPGQSTTIAHFFCIHDQLEGLYSELSTAVALNS